MPEIKFRSHVIGRVDNPFLLLDSGIEVHGPNHDTLPLAVANFATQFSQNTAGVLAFTALSMLPALGCFVFLQRHLVGGWTGAVKG